MTHRVPSARPESPDADMQPARERVQHQLDLMEQHPAAVMPIAHQTHTLHRKAMLPDRAARTCATVAWSVDISARNWVSNWDCCTTIALRSVRDNTTEVVMHNDMGLVTANGKPGPESDGAVAHTPF
jgi:hypothetical protein